MMTVPPSGNSPAPTSFAAILAQRGLTVRGHWSRALAAGAAAVIPFLLLLPYVSGAGLLGSGSATGWQTLHGSDVLLTLIAISMVGLLAVDVFVSPSPRLTAGAAGLACVAVGLAWPDFLGLPVNWSAGAYLVLLATVLAAVGAVAALGEPAQEVARGETSGLSAKTEDAADQPDAAPVEVAGRE